MQNQSALANQEQGNLCTLQFSKDLVVICESFQVPHSTDIRILQFFWSFSKDFILQASAENLLSRFTFWVKICWLM